MPKSRILIFDGNYCAHRAKHTVGHLVKGTTFGMLRITKAVVDELKPAQVVYAFDKGKPARRLAIYPSYKANRTKGHGVNNEVELAKEMLHSLGVNIAQINEVEADDIIGILVTHFREIYNEVIIVSSDFDLYQLIDGDNVVVYNPQRKVTINEDVFKENFDGFHPRKIIDIKCITGDTSDNIPGVKGVGEKGALKALKLAKGSVTNLPCDDFEGDNKLMKINSEIDIINRNLSLVIIPRKVDDLEPEKRQEMQKLIDNMERRNPNANVFNSLVRSNNFKSLGVDGFLKSFNLGRILSEDLDGWLI